ncbi:MAG TPA: hypothetical protein DCS93_18985 [Microscillaceae bacterium]|nr:hypothetical protein [Microscillaceae bacterium]
MVFHDFVILKVEKMAARMALAPTILKAMSSHNPVFSIILFPGTLFIEINNECTYSEIAINGKLTHKYQRRTWVLVIVFFGVFMCAKI